MADTYSHPTDHVIGVRVGILERDHVVALGSALAMFLWCIRHQTDKIGRVFGGATLTYKSIGDGSCSPTALPLAPEMTVRRWLRRLVDEDYVKLERVPAGFHLAIRNAKKWFGGRPTGSGLSDRPDLTGRPTGSGLSDRPDLASLSTLGEVRREEREREPARAGALIPDLSPLLGIATDTPQQHLIESWYPKWVGRYPNGGELTTAIDTLLTWEGDLGRRERLRLALPALEIHAKARGRGYHAGFAATDWIEKAGLVEPEYTGHYEETPEEREEREALPF